MLSSFLFLILPMLLLAASCAALASYYLGRRWEPVLARLHAALGSLQEGRFQRVDTEGAIDAPRAVAQGFNLALGAVEQRVGAHRRGWRRSIACCSRQWSSNRRSMRCCRVSAP